MPALVEISFDLDLGPLPEDFLPVARSHGEDPNTVSNLLEELRNKIFERGDFKPHRTDDEYLIKFLRSRYFKVEKAYMLMVRYYAFRESNKELYANVNPLSLLQLGEDDIVSVTPYRDQNGRRTMYYKFGNWKPSKIPMNDILKSGMLLSEVGSLEPKTQVVGGVAIFDLEGIAMNHILLLTPSVVNKIMSLMITCMAMRTETIHVVNQGLAFNMIFKLFKPMLNEQMRSRIFLHGNDMDSLHKHIDKDHLPAQYGGHLDKFSYVEWVDSLMKNENIKNELRLLGYDTNEDAFKIPKN